MPMIMLKQGSPGGELRIADCGFVEQQATNPQSELPNSKFAIRNPQFPILRG